MVKHRAVIVIDEAQFALLVAGDAVCVTTPFTDVEIRLAPTKPYVWHEGQAADRPPVPPAGRRVSAAAALASLRLSSPQS